MPLSARTIVTAVAASTVTLAIGGPASAAAPTVDDHVLVAKAGKPTTAKPDPKGTTAKVARFIARKDQRLERTAQAKRLGRLDEDTVTIVVGNIDEDRTELAEMTRLSDVRAVRPQVYAGTVNALAAVDRIEGRLAEAADGTLKTEAETRLAEADVALLEVHSLDGKESLSQARRVLRDARVLVSAALDADPVEDPAV